MTGPASVLSGRIIDSDGRSAAVELGGVRVRVACTAAGVAAGPVALLVRPDWTRIGGELSAHVSMVEYRGTHTDYHLETPAGTLLARDAGPPRLTVGAATGWELARIWPLGDPDAEAVGAG